MAGKRFQGSLLNICPSILLKTTNVNLKEKSWAHQNHSDLRNCSPRNLNSVIIYSPPHRSKQENNCESRWGLVLNI